MTLKCLNCGGTFYRLENWLCRDCREWYRKFADYDGPVKRAFMTWYGR